MTSSKKVQQEVDRQLRSAQDVIDKFDEIYGKFLKANTQLQGRLVEDLRKEAKKLQRVFETIKSIHTSSEVKDKKALESCQKTIEEKIEIAKMCEREARAKLRAFSKERGAACPSHEGLQAHNESWIKAAIENARKQIEGIERNSRGHHGRGDNSFPADGKRLNKLKRHLEKLEKLQELVISGNVNVNDVARLEESVHRMLRNDTNCDDNDKSDEDIYNGLNLDDIRHDRQRGDAEVDDSTFGQSTPKKAVAVSPTANKAQAQAAVKKTSPSIAVSRADSLRQQGSSTTQTAFKPASSALPAGVGRLVPNKDAAQETWDEATDLLDDDMDNANADTFGDDAMEMAGPGSLAELANVTNTMSRMGDWEKGRPASLTPTAQGRASPSAKAHAVDSTHPAASATNAINTAAAAATTTAVTTSKKSPSSHQHQRSTEHKQQSGATATGASLSHSAVSYDKALMLRLVNMSLANLPHTRDVDRQRPFEPSNPTTCPSYYPTQVISAFASPDIYREFDLETLFFIFYYHQNTYQQYFAAKQIKLQSFRYHTQLNTWFQRRGRMTEIEGGERGSFIYFNYEDTWQIEEKEDFTFNYQYLEDELR